MILGLKGLSYVSIKSFSISVLVAAINPEDDETVAMIKELLETRIRLEWVLRVLSIMVIRLLD